MFRFPRAALTLLLIGAVTPLHAHKDDYLGDTFVFVTLERHEFELEYWLDARSDPRGALHTTGFEYGFTDQFMADASLRWAQDSGGPFRFETGFLELRRRFGEEGAHRIDTAVSLEYEVERDESGELRRLLEPRLVLSRDFRGWNGTLNLFYAAVLGDAHRSAFEAAAGLRTPSRGRWNAGVEFQRQLALENKFLVIPQLWYRVSDEGFLKAGAGRNFAGAHDAFVRVAVEFEF
jgi:hypothetical protein